MRGENPYAAGPAAAPVVKESPTPALPRADGRRGGGSSASRVVLLMAAVLLILAAGGVGAAYAMGWIDVGKEYTPLPDETPSQTGGGGGPVTPPEPDETTPAPPTDAAMVTFLEAMEEAIYRAGEGRNGIDHLTSVYPDFATQSEAAGIAQEVIDNRTQVLTMLAAIDVPDNTAARECHRAFEQAMTYSLRADEEYLDWVYGGPKPGTQPNNYQAGEWKKTFVRKYNALARAHDFAANWSTESI